jgi:hypothetical protein
MDSRRILESFHHQNRTVRSRHLDSLLVIADQVASPALPGKPVLRTFLPAESSLTPAMAQMPSVPQIAVQWKDALS